MAGKTVFPPNFLDSPGWPGYPGQCSAAIAAAPNCPAVKKDGLYVLNFLGSLGGGSKSVRKLPG